MQEKIERIWEYSNFYGDLLFSANKLNQEGENYAAFLLLLNVVELVFKSIRGSDDDSLSNDIVWLEENGYIESNEKELFSSENGLKTIRNKMIHRNLYSYFLEIDGVAYSFADKETWDYIYSKYASMIIKILYNTIQIQNARVDITM